MCVCVCVYEEGFVFGGGTTLSLCLRVDDRVFGAVDERVWSASLVKTRESSLDLRFPLCQSDQNEIPVSETSS